MTHANAAEVRYVFHADSVAGFYSTGTAFTTTAVPVSWFSTLGSTSAVKLSQPTFLFLSRHCEPLSMLLNSAFVHLLGSFFLQSLFNEPVVPTYI